MLRALRADKDCTVATTSMCLARDFTTQEHTTSFSKSYGAKACHWEELLEKLHVDLKLCVLPNNVVMIFTFSSIILHFLLIISSGWGDP